MLKSLKYILFYKNFSGRFAPYNFAIKSRTHKSIYRKKDTILFAGLRPAGTLYGVIGSWRNLPVSWRTRDCVYNDPGHVGTRRLSAMREEPAGVTSPGRSLRDPATGRWRNGNAPPGFSPPLSGCLPRVRLPLGPLPIRAEVVRWYR
jgi:hypothetical protein